jgi:hypothetical protein
MPLTGSELAQRMGRTANKTFMERLRYWTREGLLKPVGARSPGRGQRRVYPDTADQDAAILNVMLEAKVPAAHQQIVMGVFRQERHLGQLHPSKLTKPFFLVVVGFEDGRGYAYFHPAPGSPANVDPRVFKIPEFAKQITIFDLTSIFATGGTKNG